VTKLGYQHTLPAQEGSFNDKAKREEHFIRLIAIVFSSRARKL
jgi:hypothetical protein